MKWERSRNVVTSIRQSRAFYSLILFMFAVVAVSWFTLASSHHQLKRCRRCLHCFVAVRCQFYSATIEIQAKVVAILHINDIVCLMITLFCDIVRLLKLQIIVLDFPHCVRLEICICFGTESLDFYYYCY